MVCTVQKTRNDIQASLDSASQLQLELDKSLANLIGVLSLFRDELPADCNDALSQIVDKDVIPSLEHLGNTLLQLDTRMECLHQSLSSDSMHG